MHSIPTPSLLRLNYPVLGTYSASLQLFMSLFIYSICISFTFAGNSLTLKQPNTSLKFLIFLKVTGLNWRIDHLYVLMLSKKPRGKNSKLQLIIFLATLSRPFSRAVMYTIFVISFTLLLTTSPILQWIDLVLMSLRPPSSL